MQIQRLSQFLNRLQNIRLLRLHRGSSIWDSRRYARSRYAVERLEDRRLLTFVAAPNVSATHTPSSVALGDINGDGKLDLAIANRGFSNVSVRLGNGLGGFTGTTNVPVGSGSSPSSVAVGDFNGDGKLDFATANSGTNNVSVRLGNGLGLFTGTTTVSVGTSPSSVAVGDFNGDGKLDFATANSGSSNVSVRLGNGLGGFTGTTTVPVGSSPSSVTVGDFNGDGKLDLATANSGSNDVSVRLGNGLGGFSGTTTVSVGPSPSSVATGDFNGDGKFDFATANSGHHFASVRLGNGLGGFSGTSNFTVASSPSFVTVGDFNGDGRPDLATANSGSTSSNVSVLLNNYPIRVNLSVSKSTGTEAGTTAITVTATAATPVPSDQTVNLAVTGTGITTGDYTLTDGDAAAGIQIKILSGQTTGTVTFTVVDDLENEGDETATLTISSPSTGLTLGTTLSQNITITDNDTNAAPTAVVLTPSSASLAENASTAEAIELSTISITDDGAGTNTLSLSGADAASFEIVSGKLRLKAGVVLDFETKPSYLVRVDVDDTTVGGTPDAFADFTLNLTNVAEVHLAASAATGTEAGQTVITVTATADSAVIGDQTVDLAVTGTGITTGDYTLTDGDVAAGIQIKILSGQTTGTVTFTVVDDLENEGDETATLTISSPSTGLMLGTTLSQNIAITDNDTAVDITAPTATVRSLPLTTTTSAITLAIDTNDPAGAVGNPVSGVASYDVYVAVDSGAWSLFADDVPASQSTVNFTPSSNHRYWFRAIAKDNAGNTEVESANPLPEANTFVTDVEGPNTSVTSATPDANGLFTLNLQGSDVGGSTVNRFRVFVKIDDGTAVEIPQTNIDAGAANGSGVHSAMTNYQGLRDGVSHTYTFFTRGIDSKGNLEAAPTDANADIRQTHTFATPVALAATDIEVQNGQAQRSYIRNVDLLFNDTNGLQSLIDNDRIRVERFDLLNAAPTAGTGTNVTIVGAALNGNSIKLDFGAAALVAWDAQRTASIESWSTPMVMARSTIRSSNSSDSMAIPMATEKSPPSMGPSPKTSPATAWSTPPTVPSGDPRDRSSYWMIYFRSWMTERWRAASTHVTLHLLERTKDQLMTNLRKLFIPFSFCCGVLWSSNGADAAIIVNVQDKTITAGSTSNFVDVFIRSSDGTDTLDFANYDFAISLVSGSSTLQFSGTQNALQTGLPNYVFVGDAGPVTEVTLNNSQYAANAGTISFNGVSLTTSPNTALLARLEIDSVLGLLTPAQANGNQFRISLVNSGNTLFLDENGATLGIDPSSFSLANSGLITIQSSAAVPEPSTFAVIAMTLGGLGVLRRRKNQKAEAV